MRVILAILMVALNPFFWADLYRWLSEGDEEGSLDLTDTPESAGQAEVQRASVKAWETRQRKKGRWVE